VVVTVIGISFLAAANREFVIPKIRDQLSGDAHDLGGERAKELHPQVDDSTDILLRGQQTVAKDRCIREPNFLLPTALASSFKQLQAANAFYQTATDRHEAGYLFKGMTQPRDLAKRPSLAVDGRPVVLTPKDYPWLQPDECFVVSNVTFELLNGSDNWRQYGSLMDLIRGLHLQSLGVGADVAVTIHSRLLQPLCDITLLFLGLPLILRRGTPNIFLAIGLCVGVVVAFMIGLLGAQYLGSSYLISPSLAAWLPLMVFVPIAVAMSTPLRE
jgi:lipopolysaccharide export system permease protein